MPNHDPSTDPSSDPSTTRRNVLIGGGVVLLALLAAAVWWFTRPEAATVDIDNALGSSDETAAAPASSSPEPAPDATDEATDTATDGATTGATDAPNATDGSTATEESSADSTPVDGDASGTWTVTTDAIPYDFEAAEGTFVGFRIDEELSSVGNTTAVARTPAVTGDITVDDTTLSEGTFTADLTQVTSDRSQRNPAIQRALNTSAEPEATFEVTEPVDFGEVPPAGEAVEIDVVGDLTVNGTTVSDTWPMQAGLTADGLLVVTGSFDVALADFDVSAPSAPIVVSVADEATVEVQLYLERPDQS